MIERFFCKESSVAFVAALLSTLMTVAIYTLPLL